MMIKLVLRWQSRLPGQGGSFQQDGEVRDFGAFVEGMEETVIRDEDGQVHPFCRTDELIIPGSHNLENALAAAAIAYFAGIEPDVITQGLKEFQGVERRIRILRTG